MACGGFEGVKLDSFVQLLLQAYILSPLIKSRTGRGKNMHANPGTHCRKGRVRIDVWYNEHL